MLNPVGDSQGPFNKGAIPLLLIHTTLILVAPYAPVEGGENVKGYVVPAT